MGNRPSSTFKPTEPVPDQPNPVVVDPVVDPVGQPSNGSLPAEPAPPIAFINCGSASEGHSSNELVSLAGNSYGHSNPTTVDIKADNPDYAGMGRSHRWGPANFGFNVKVPVPGEYDVTLVFCEIYAGNFGLGKRVFDVAIEGIEEHNFKNVDIFAKVGANKIHTISIQNVQAEDFIKIHLRKGAAENAFISGIIIGAVENPIVAKPAPPIPAPSVQVSQAQYDECIRNIDAYIADKKNNPPENIKHTPTFMFHNAGTPVRGLVITYHGFGQYPYDHRIIGRYLYDQGYDVLHTMLAGHFFGGTKWPSTKLSKEYGGDTIPQTVFQNPELQGLLKAVNTDPTRIPVLIERLTQLNPDFERVMSAQTYMNSLDQDEDPNFARFFDSNHRDYAIEGTKYVRMCDAYPGPVHVMGLSVGGAVAVGVAALNPERIERCVTFAPLMELWEQFPGTKRSLVNFIGPLGLAPDFAWDPKNPFPVSAFTAAGRFGGSLTSSKKFQNVFKSKQVQMFMVLTENEDAADIPTNKKFFADCGGRSSDHYLFNYPFNYGVPHPLLDPTGNSRGLRNKYYKPLYQQCFQFLTTGHVDTTPMFSEKSESRLPEPPRAFRGEMGYYAKADQIGGHNRYANQF